MKQFQRLAAISFALTLVVLIGNALRATASVAPFRRYQQTYSVTLLSDLGTIRNAQPGFIAACEENGKAYVAQAAGGYTVAPPRVVAGQDGIVWVDFLTVASPVTSGFIGNINWNQIETSTIPTSLAGHYIADGVANSRTIAGTPPITVNGATNATLANDITLGLTYGSTAASVSFGGSNAPGTSSSAARADHVHAAPAIGTVAGTLAAGDDSRFGDDRVASGLRSATTVVGVSSATAPSQYQVLTGISSTAASWQLIGNASLKSDAAIALSKLASCSTNQFVVGGTSNSCSAMTDTLHGSRGGGSLHPVANSGAAGFVPQLNVTPRGLLGSIDGTTVQWLQNIGTAFILAGSTPNRVLSTDGTSASWTQVSNAMLSGGIDWSTKLTGFPTVTAVAPIHVNGTTSVSLGNLTAIGIVAASASNGGYMSSTHYTKLEGIPADAVTAQRTITATAPLRIDGGNSANLSANRTISVTAATTSASGVVQLAGDLGGSATAPSVLKVRGATVATAGGSLPTGVVLQAVNSSTIDYGKVTNANVDDSASIAVTKLAAGSSGQMLANLGGTNQFISPSNLTIAQGIGSQNRLVKYTNNGSSIGNSAITDVNGAVTVDGSLQARAHALYQTSGSEQWVKVGTFTAGQTGQTLRLIAYVHQGYNSNNDQDAELHIVFKSANGLNVDPNGFAGNGFYYTFGPNAWFDTPGRVKWKANAAGINATAFDLYLYLPAYTNGSHYEATPNISSSWTDAPAGAQSDPGSGSSTVLVAPAALRLAGLTGLNFSASATSPIIKQNAVTGTSPTSLTIEAQSATDSSWYFYSGDLRLNAGTNAAGAKGLVELGVSGSPGSYASFASTGASVHGNLSAEGRLSTTSPVSGGSLYIDPSGYGSQSFVVYRQATTIGGSSGQLSVDFTKPTGSLLNGTAYHAVITVMAQGAVTRTFGATATWYKDAGGVITNTEANTFGNGGGLYFAQGTSPDANTLRIVVNYIPGTTNWKFKFEVTEN